MSGLFYGVSDGNWTHEKIDNYPPLFYLCYSFTDHSQVDTIPPHQSHLYMGGGGVYERIGSHIISHFHRGKTIDIEVQRKKDGHNLSYGEK